MTKDKIELLRERSAAAELGGGQARIETQHKKGKLTARERIECLLDKGSFEEFDKFVLHASTEFGLDKKRFPGDGGRRGGDGLREDRRPPGIRICPGFHGHGRFPQPDKRGEDL